MSNLIDMKCNKVQKLMNGYIDNNLPDNLKNELKKHLSTCETCGKLHQNVLSTLDLLKPTENIAKQPYYYTSLKQKIENKLEAKPSLMAQILSRKVFQPAVYLASIVFAVYIGILIGSNTTESNQYSELGPDSNTPLESFAEYSYFNELNLEEIESFIIEENE